MKKEVNQGLRQFEWPLINFTLWISVVAFCLALILNFFIEDYDQRSNYIFGGGLVLMLGLIYLFKIGFNYQLLKTILVILIWSTFNCSWYLNNGFTKSVIILFAFFFTFLVFINDKKGIIVSSVLMAVNLSILFFIKEKYPLFIEGPWTAEQEKVDVIYTLLIGWIIIPAYVLIAKNRYVKAYSRAQKSEALKSSFLANMSHEIRTPLNAIMGFSELIKEEPEHRNNEKYLDVIHGNSVYLHDLIDQVLNISIIESGNLGMNKQTFSVQKMMEQLALESKFYLGTKAEKIDIRIRLDRPDLMANTDKTQLEQVFKNLITNAIKFTEEGFIEIGVTELDHDLFFFVSDSGLGMPQEDLSSIFDRFVKLSDGQCQNSRGVGLGLYLCKQIVKHLGGFITVDSEEGKGTRFEFSIPK